MANTPATKTKREIEAERRNERRISQSAEKLKSVTENCDNVVNVKAIEIMQRIKATKNVNDEKFVNLCYLLATILIQSKTKSLNGNDKTFNEHVTNLKRDVTAITNTNGHGLKYDVYVKALDELYYSEYNKDGDLVIKCKDKKQAQAIEKRLAELNEFEGGLDLLQEITAKLFAYIRRALDKGIDNISDTYLLDTYVVTIPHSKVYKRGGIKPKELWRQTTTNHVKELSKEVSRYIRDLKRATEQTVCYDALQTEIFDENTGNYDVITTYHKANNISVCDISDYNGKLITQTAITQTEDLIQTILERANFTRVQAYIFKHHFTNDESMQEIADKLKIDVKNAEMQLTRIKNKCVKTGIFEKYGLFSSDIVHISNAEKSQQIICKDLNNNYVCTFESLGKASKALNISKGCLSECLKGKRKTAGGYIFEYSR